MLIFIGLILQIGTEHHPFDDELVTDAQDDFRLASSAFSLISVDPVPINAGFALTNKGLWAVYVVSGDPNDESIQAFVQTKRIATRASRTAVHNVAVEYDQYVGRFFDIAVVISVLSDRITNSPGSSKESPCTGLNP